MTIEQIRYNNDILRQGYLSAGFGDKLIYHLRGKVYVFERKDLCKPTFNVEPFLKNGD